MGKKVNKIKKISRRGMLPIFGGSLLIPFLGFGNSEEQATIVQDDDDTYQTLLKPDGTTVRVKTSKIQDSRIVKKNISNKSFLKWLDK